MLYGSFGQPPESENNLYFRRYIQIDENLGTLKGKHTYLDYLKSFLGERIPILAKKALFWGTFWTLQLLYIR